MTTTTLDDPPVGPPAGRAAVAARSVAATKRYGSGDTAVTALDEVSLDLPAGRFTAIMGPSGSGKSTLMHCLAGLDALTSGQVFVGDVELSRLSDKELTILRRTRIGSFDLSGAVDLEHIAADALLQPAAAAALALPTLTVGDDEARDLRHGKRLPGAASRVSATPAAAIGPDGTLIGVLERRGADLKSAMNMPEEQS